MIPIILGSASKSRQLLLKRHGYDFTVMPANIDETAVTDTTDPNALVLAIAKAKAQTLLTQIDAPSLLITADQIVYCQQEIRGKPKTASEARRFLKSYGDHPAHTYTAVVIHNLLTQESMDFVDRATIHFHPIPTAVIDRLVQLDELYDWAGAFQIEGPLFSEYIDAVIGAVDSIMGLPMHKLTPILHAATQ